MDVQQPDDKHARPEERLAAAERRSPGEHVVWDRYGMVNGAIRPIAPYKVRRMYPPMGTPQIVGELARVKLGDPSAALRFVRRWGILGYGALSYGAPPAGNSEETPGDPLEWIWAHANGVRTALQVTKLMAKRDYDGLRELIDSVIKSTHGYAVREQIFPVFLLEPAGAISSPVAAHYAATLVLENIVNQNLRGVYLQIRDYVPYIADIAPARQLAASGYHLLYTWDALISVVYRHVADIVVGGQLRVCDLCGLPFLQTHARQRFCPAPPPERSLCEQRYTKARQRQEGKAP